MSLADDPKFIKMKISGRLPTPKGVALEVINLTQRDDASNHEIAHLIGADPALSARVIKAANVLLANSSRPVITIADAVTVLGARGLRQLVLGIALIVDYRHGPCKHFDYPHFWAHSLMTGIAARHLAEHARLAAADEIFTVGLLCNIGQLGLATVYADDYGSLLAQDKGRLELQQLEWAKFGFDESALSEAILADMHFPKIFQTLVRDYAQPDASKVAEGSREWRLLHLLHVAMLIADVCLSIPAERGKLVQKLRMQAARLAIEEADLIAIGDACARDWLEWLTLLSMGGMSLPSFAELLQQSDSAEVDADAVRWSNALPDDYKMRVLLVEDDRAMRIFMESMLAAAGHTVFSADNGVAAMRLVEQHHPQLVISDWRMPQMDGITFCRKLRECDERRSLYVIMLTSKENPDKLVEAFEAGADDCLSKPLAPKIFFARLRAAQRVVQLQEELAFDREQLLRFSKDLALSNERLQRLALTDALTELPNRRFAMERLEQEWALSQRGDRALSCMMVDIDHFKQINDKFGHQVGDEALKHVAHCLRHSARTQDVVCRYGGEEFVVICPDTGMDA
ncbi:MAG TPA: HDOD domain-containing protein, partial [Gallionella sp.]|nr:HDOD domain-containing protein [Gallionella sp.]